MIKYKVLNNVAGWLMFLVALTVYMLTLEPSVSLWDCGEFISASYKLQVVHPPGAPFFLLLGRFFSMFAGSPEKVAFMVNSMSATMSALTVLFTFWITTHFARKMVAGKDGDTTGKTAIIIGSGLVAALALTFSDSFWFSAVEGEVYAMSSAFTALTFWAMLKWEESNSKYADKWIILIAYLIGLAIGTHLLNLLVTPAIAFIYYFKKYKVTRKGMALAFLIGLAILFFIQKGVISGVPAIMAYMDLFFVNDLGLGFGSGAWFAVILIIGVVVAAIVYTNKHKYKAWNLAFVCMAYVLLGYSSYAMVVVRSLDNPPIDMNNPEEPFNLLSYINREQYGDRPLLYGPYFNAQPVDIKYGSTIYAKGKQDYLNLGKKRDYAYEPEYQTFFPRMGDMQKENGDVGYRFWSGNRLNDIQLEIDGKESLFRQSRDPQEKQRLQGEIQELKRIKPNMMDNLGFLFSYQLNHMYFRYFMWNFVGRQNDQQGHSYNQYLDGNWISGINVIDNFRLGPQKNLPDTMKNNKGRNKFYFLPLLLGILGIWFHFKKGKHDAIVTSVLFVFTGILIIIFLNQPPFEPRERDYSHVGSFQTFCIWIGLGVLFIADKLKKWMTVKVAGLVATVFALIAPTLMAKDGWDDHDRSGRRLGIDFAIDYLASCAPNAILFTNGDNDTYPLWYAQNVEHIRTDVRVINMSLLPTDWYSQVLLDKVYESDPLPLTLTKDDLAAGTNEYFEYTERLDPKQFYPLRAVLNNLLKKKGEPGLPTRNLKIAITPEMKKQIIANNVVPKEDIDKIADDIHFSLPKNGIMKSDLVVLDLIATNAEKGWPRPIYFTTTSGSDGFNNLEPYFQREGLTFRLVPIRSEASRGNPSRIADDLLYDRLMTKFKYSNMKEKPNFYLDDKASLVPAALQQLFVSLAGEYTNKYKNAEFEIQANDTSIAKGAPNADALRARSSKLKAEMPEMKKRALALLDKCTDVIPEKLLPPSGNMKGVMANIYYQLGDKEKAKKNLTEMYESAKQDLDYFVQFKNRRQYTMYHRSLTEDAFNTMKSAADMAKEWNMNDLAKKYNDEIKDFDNRFNN